jgi:NTE family protein
MKALVSGGGGSKGAFGVGSIYHLLYEKEICYSGYFGISVGAITSAFLGQFKDGEEKLAAQSLTNMWSTISTKDIYKSWFPLGSWHALWKNSFFDSRPLQNLIRQNISLDRIRSSGKQVFVGAVSVSAGKYKIFDQTSDHFIDAVLASAAFPGLLSPVEINGELYSDGGIKQISPINVAIENGATELDIILTSPETRNKYFIEDPHALDIIKRALDLSSDKIMSNDIDKLLMFNKLSEANMTDKKLIKTHIIRPQFNLIDNLLDFDPIKIRKMMDIGYEQAVLSYKET